MSAAWLIPAFLLQLSAPPAAVPAGAAGLRYLPPGAPATAVPGRGSDLPRAAVLEQRDDGEIRLHFPQGYRMEARARRAADGRLQLVCSEPGHPAGAHVHANPEGGR